ncbi:MAG TPA: D-2-hydroxyacid dehydrogenase [Clostridiaceae bacterium]
MIVISVTNFDKRHIEKMKEAGLEYYYANNEGIDPHGVETSDEFNQAIYNLPEAVKSKAQIIIWDCFHITQRLIRECPKVKWVQHPGAGVNTGDFWTNWEMLKENHITVTTAKVHAIPISEMIVTYMLDLSKHMPLFYKRKGEKIYHDEVDISAQIMNKRSALIVGTGNIGSELARKLKLGFDMYVVGVNTDGRKLDYFDEMYTLKDLDKIISNFDYVVCTSVLVEGTKHMINAKRLKLMKNTAFLINASRGGLIVEGELIEALKRGEIAAAAIDCFEIEPLPKASELWNLENVIITPHMSGGRPDNKDVILEKFLSNLPHFKKGEISKMSEVANIKKY